MGVSHVLIAATAAVFSTTARATSVQTTGNPTSFIKRTHYSDEACATVSSVSFEPANMCKLNMVMNGVKYGESYDCTSSGSVRKSSHQGESCEQWHAPQSQASGTCHSSTREALHCPAVAAPGIREVSYNDAACTTHFIPDLPSSRYHPLGLCYPSFSGYESYTFDGTNVYHKKYLGGATPATDCSGTPSFEDVYPCGTCKNMKKFPCDATTTMTVTKIEGSAASGQSTGTSSSSGQSTGTSGSSGQSTGTSGASGQSTGTSGASGQLTSVASRFIKMTMYSDAACTTVNMESFIPARSCTNSKPSGQWTSSQSQCTSGGMVKIDSYQDASCSTTPTSQEMQADTCLMMVKYHCPEVEASGVRLETYSDSACSSLKESSSMAMKCHRHGSHWMAATIEGNKLHRKRYASSSCEGTATATVSLPCGTCTPTPGGGSYTKVLCGEQASGASVPSAAALVATVLASIAAI